jgi:hypothetical protein
MNAELEGYELAMNPEATARRPGGNSPFLKFGFNFDIK